MSVLLKAYRDLVVYPIKVGVILTNKKGKAVNMELQSKVYPKKESIYGSVAKGYIYDTQLSKDLDMPTKCIFIVLNPFSNSAKFTCPTSSEIVSHEAIHVKDEMYQELGIKSDPNNNEPEAYLVGAIVKLAMQMIEELKQHEDFKKEIGSKV